MAIRLGDPIDYDPFEIKAQGKTAAKIGEPVDIDPFTGKSTKSTSDRILDTVIAAGKGVYQGVTTDLPDMVGKGLQFLADPSNPLAEYGDTAKAIGEYVQSPFVNPARLPTLIPGVGNVIKETGKLISDWAEKRAEAEPLNKQDFWTPEGMTYNITKTLGPSIIPGGLITKGARGALGVTKLAKEASLMTEAMNVLRTAGMETSAVKMGFRAASKGAQAERAAQTALNIGAGATAGLFGASQAQETKDAAERAGIEPGLSPYLTGAIEALGEFFGTKYLGKMLKLDEAAVGIPGIKDFMKTLGVEVGTEVGQQVGEAGVEKLSGIRPDANLLEEGAQAGITALGMTILTAGLGKAVGKISGRNGKEATPQATDQNVPPPTPGTPPPPVVDIADIRSRYEEAQKSGVKFSEFIAALTPAEKEALNAAGEQIAAPATQEPVKEPEPVKPWHEGVEVKPKPEPAWEEPKPVSKPWYEEGKKAEAKPPVELDPELQKALTPEQITETVMKAGQPGETKANIKDTIEKDEPINSITREQAGDLIKDGNPEVIKHIKEGLAQGIPAEEMQDAIRNQIMDEVSNAPKGDERKQVVENIKKVEPEINQALKGEKPSVVEAAPVKEPWQMTKDEWSAVSTPSELTEEPTDIVKQGLKEIGVPDIQMKSKNLSSAGTIARNSIDISKTEPWIQKIREYQKQGINTFQGWARKALIDKATKEGKTVPAEVLADYPDLAPANVTETPEPNISEPISKVEDKKTTSKQEEAKAKQKTKKEKTETTKEAEVKDSGEMPEVRSEDVGEQVPEMREEDVKGETQDETFGVPEIKEPSADTETEKKTEGNADWLAFLETDEAAKIRAKYKGKGKQLAELAKVFNKKVAEVEKEEAKKSKAAPKAKLKNTDEALRRHWEIRRDRVEQTEGKEIAEQLRVIQKETTRADLFDVALGENATPGAHRFIEAIRNNIIPFTEWAGRKAGAGKRRWSTKPEQMLLNILDGKEHITPGKLREWTSAYIQFLGELRAELSGLETIDEISKKYAEWRDIQTIGTVSTEFGQKEFKRKGRMIGDIFIYDLLRNGSKFAPQYYGMKYWLDEENNETKKKQSIHDRPTHKLEDIKREGLPDYREGKDVTGEDIKKVFGFASVTYGKYADQRVRQLHTNHAYDSFHDLAVRLKVEPKDLSLGGTLHLAIGALGHGKHSATYTHGLQTEGGERVNVINLTRDRGDGALAHEWAHALDFFLRKTDVQTTVKPRTSEGLNEYRKSMSGQDVMRRVFDHMKMRYAPESIMENIKRFITGGWHYRDIKNDSTAAALRWLQNERNWLKSGTNTEFYRNAAKLDAGKGEKGRYWSKSEEMFARAFEGAMFDSLGGDNFYLVSDFASEGKTKPPAYKGIPYPEGDDRSQINNLIDELLTAIEWTEKGPQVKNDAKFSLDSAKDEYRKAIDEGIANIKDIAASMKAPKEVIEEEPETKTISKKPVKYTVQESKYGDWQVFNDRGRFLGEFDTKQQAYEWAVENEAAETELSNPIPIVADSSTIFTGMDDADIDSMIDASTSENFPETPRETRETISEGKKEAEKKAETRQETSKEPVKDEKTIGSVAKDFKDAGIEGISEALDGLYKLFGGGNVKMFAGLPGGFDEKTYNQAKPHFIKAYQATLKAGRSAREFVDLIVKAFGVKIKPFLAKFMKDVRDGVINIEQEEAKTEAQEKAKEEVNGLLSGRNAKLSTPSERIAEAVTGKLRQGDTLTKDGLIGTADHAFGGTRAEGKYTSKDMFDALELGINKYIMGREGVFDPSLVSTPEAARASIDDLRKEVMDKIPSQAGLRSEEQDEFQQFSTPPDLAYTMAWAANITKNDTVLEPSAGLGGLLMYGKIAGAQTVGNELSKRRLALLKSMGFDAVFNENAEQINNILPTEIEPTVVLMNPPFSSTAGRIEGQRSSENGIRHMNQALSALEPGGRAVILMGRGRFEDSKAMQTWLAEMASGKEYSLRAVVEVSGKGYAKYGTTYDNRIIVIDKVAGKVDNIIRERVEDVKDAIPLLKEIRDDRQEAPTKSESAQPKPSEQASTQTAEGSESGVSSGQPVSATTSELGTGKRAGTAGSEKADAGEHLAESETGGATESTKLPDTERGQSAADLAGRDEGTGTGSTTADRTGRGKGSVKSEIESSSRVEDKSEGELTDSLYESYKPQRLEIPGAKPHPGNLVQSAAMASVQPPVPTYKPNLPKEVITKGKLSAAQIEAIVYAGQAHEQTLQTKSEDGKAYRRGFFIGDGTGVGKGREISGIIMDNMRQGRKKAIWLTANRKLAHDAVRDWTGIGGDKDSIFELGKTKLGNDVAQKEGIMFVTYGVMRSQSFTDTTGKKISKEKAGGKGGVSRINQIIKWVGKDFDGVIAFDESHNMANLAPSKGKRGAKKASSTALTGEELQKMLPNARVVYVSATGATEVNNLAYAERLGLWGPGTSFPTRDAFIVDMNNGGLAAMEIVSRDAKALGSYISRNLSYDDVAYDTLKHDLNPEQHMIYDKLAEAWQITMKNLDDALKATGVVATGHNGQDKTLNGDAKKDALSRYWGTNQRFFNQILTSMQMPSVVTDAEQMLKEGKSVVLQLVNTNESTQKRRIAEMEEEGELEDLDLTPRDMLIEYLKNSFPVQQFEQYTDAEGNLKSRPVFASDGSPVINKEAVRMREDLIADLKNIKVPHGPLELIMDAFGTEVVAEVTGRTQRVVWATDEKGNRKKVIEKWSESKSVKDADLFQVGKKRVLVFSYAGGTGASFHAAMDAKNQQQRVHYLVQAGWEATRAVQGFGRTHRSNQKIAPIYKLVTTNLNGQKRFISSIARRLDQLGALTKGQRQAGSQGIFKAEDNLENDYAKDALYRFFVDLRSEAIPELTWGEVTDQLGLKNLLDANGSLNTTNLPDVPRFLNRILSVNIDFQNKVFDAFQERLTQGVELAQAQGRYDTGLQNYKADAIKKVADQTVYTHPASGAETKHVELEAQHKNDKIDFEKITKMIDRAKSGNKASIAGFYKNKKSGRIWAVRESGTHTDKKTGAVNQMLILNGVSSHNFKYMKQDEFSAGESNWSHYLKIDNAQADKLWQEAYEAAPEFRSEQVNLITGVLLPIWDRLPTFETKVYRVQTDEGERMIGRVIPNKMLNQVLGNLGAKVGQVTPEAAFQKIGQGATVRLANGWRIKESRVSNEKRVEILGNLWAYKNELTAAGAFMERVNYTERWFIPTGRPGYQAFQKIIETKPISEIEDAGQGEPSFSRSDFEDFASFFSTESKFDIEQTEGDIFDYQSLLDKDYGKLTDKERFIVNGLMTPEDLTMSRSRDTMKSKGQINEKGQTDSKLETLRAELEKYLKKPLPRSMFTQGKVSDDIDAATRAVAGLFRKEIVFFHNNTPGLYGFNGVALPSNNKRIYINDSARKPAIWTAGHEMLHLMKRDRPDLYAYLLDNVYSQMKNTDKYKKWLTKLMEKEGKTPSDALVYEEILADFMGDQFTDPKFWSRMSANKPSIFRQLITAVHDFFSKIINRLKAEKATTEMFFSDIEKARDIAAEVMAKYSIRSKTEIQGEAGDIAFSGQTSPFFSQLHRVLSENLPEQVSPTLFNKVISANREGIRGIKPEEIADAKATIVAIFGDKKTLPKQEILDYLKAIDRTDVQDVVLGDNRTIPQEKLNQRAYQRYQRLYDDLTEYEQEEVSQDVSNAEPIDNTHFSQYTLPGAIEGSYREQFVTVPKYAGQKLFDFGLVKVERNLQSVTQGTTKLYYDGKFLAEYGDDPKLDNGEYKQRPESYWVQVANNLFDTGDRLNTIKQIGTDWQDGHSQYSSIKNPIVRIRFNDRQLPDGSVSRFIEEIQGPSKENEAKMPEIYKKYKYQIGLKRILQGIAEENVQRAENGEPLITRLSWTSGDMQAARYDLSKQIDKLAVRKGRGMWILNAYKDGVMVIPDTASNDADLEKYIGKDLAARILKDGTGGYYSGLDLKVGGEGLKRLYDQTIPKFLEKYGEEWGAKISKSDIAIEAESWRVDTPNGRSLRHIFNEQTARNVAKEQQGTVSKDVSETLPVPSIPITEAMQSSILGEGQPLFSRADISEVSSVSDTVEQRMKSAKGIPQNSFREKMAQRLESTVHSFTRHFPLLNPKIDGAVIDVLRLAENIPEYSIRTAVKEIRDILGGLQPNEKKVFERVILLDDMMKDIENGILSGQLPFGYTDVAQVQQDLDNYKAAAGRSPEVTQALARRKTFMDGLRSKLTNAGLLPDSVNADDRYFHHQVLEHMAIRATGEQFTGLSSGDMRLKKKGWQLARKGSYLDYNTSYVESEMEVVSQAISQIEKKKTIEALRREADIIAQVKADAKAQGIDNWKDLIPEDHILWQPEKGNHFYNVFSLTEKVLDQLLADIDTWNANMPFTELMKSNEVKQVLAMGGRKQEWVIPKRLAKTLDNFRAAKEDNAVGKFSTYTLNSWKQWILLNPLRIVKYNLNNLSGDMDIALAYDYKIMKYFKQATADLYRDMKGKQLSPALKAEIDAALRKSVMSSGISIQEIPDISETGLFRILTGKDTNLINKLWKTSKDFTNLRENILRLAAYRYFKDQIAAGTNPYGASKQTEVDKIKNADDRAAKLARELIGDYGNVSQAGQYIRSHMIPFYSFMEINAPRYVRLFRNLKHEGRGTAPMSGVMAWKATKLGLKASILYGLVSLWNATFWPEEEEELGKSGRRQLHIILGRNDDGSIRSLRFQGALSDALSWFSLENAPDDFKEIMAGRKSWSKQFEETYKAPVNKLIQGARPFEKTIGEIATGKTLYPDVFNPRPIRDKVEHAMKALAVDMPYRYFTGKPSRGDEVAGFVLYKTDPGEAAYYDALANIRDFYKERDVEIADISPTKKSNALYYYKQAKKYGDKKAQEKYMKEYFDAGGKRQDILKSIKKSDPLSFVQIKYRTQFMQSLDPQERKTFEKARQWWMETYAK